MRNLKIKALGVMAFMMTACPALFGNAVSADSTQDSTIDFGHNQKHEITYAPEVFLNEDGEKTVRIGIENQGSGLNPVIEYNAEDQKATIVGYTSNMGAGYLANDIIPASEIDGANLTVDLNAYQALKENLGDIANVNKRQERRLDKGKKVFKGFMNYINV